MKHKSNSNLGLFLELRSYFSSTLYITMQLLRLKQAGCSLIHWWIHKYVGLQGFLNDFFLFAGVVRIQPLRMFLPAGISQRTCSFLCFAGNHEEKIIMNDLFSPFLLHQLALIPFPNLHLHLLPKQNLISQRLLQASQDNEKNPSIMEILCMDFPLLNQLAFLFK